MRRFAEAELKCIFTFLLQRFEIELEDKSIRDPVMILEPAPRILSFFQKNVPHSHK